VEISMIFLRINLTHFVL